MKYLMKSKFFLEKKDYLKTYENIFSDDEKLSAFVPIALDILVNFYGNFFSDIRIKQIGRLGETPFKSNRFIIELKGEKLSVNIIKTYPPDVAAGVIRRATNHSIIQFIGYSPEMRAQRPEFLEVQMNLKNYFEYLLSEVVIKTHEHTFIADLEKAAKIITDNENEITTENFELFCSAKKYNL